jgi:1-propanol dehydrogenase
MNHIQASPKLLFGENALQGLESLPPGPICIVTDPFMVKSGGVHSVTRVLDRQQRGYTIFSEIEPDPSIQIISRGLQHIFHHKPDSVIALGGGSAIDAAKAILYFCVRFKAGFMDRKYIHKPFFVAIPTTSGTGSEVTSYAVVTDRENNVKIPLSDPVMIPDMAILDSDFTKTLPPDLVANTGMDVLTHAVEAFVSKQANDFSDMYAKSAAQMAFRYLPALYSQIDNPCLREKMYTASTMAGLAFTNSGLGINHSIAHTLGAQFHIPHGRANAMLLPYLIAFNAGLSPYGQEGVPHRYAELARHLGFDYPDDKLACKALIAAVQVLNQMFGIPTSLEELGVERRALEQKLDGCIQTILDDMCTPSNPVAITPAQLRQLLLDVYKGKTLW